MKVLYDYQAFQMQNHGGVSRCFSELCSRMPDYGISYEIGIRESSNIYLKEKGMCEDLRPLNYTHDKIFGQQQKFKGHWWMLQHLLSPFGGRYDFKDINRKYCEKVLAKQDFDIFHPTFFDRYFLQYLKGKPFVLTIHDMIPELYPQYFKRDDMQIVGKQILAPLASAIVAVSENTKIDIVNILHVPEDKVHVIYHGSSMPKSVENGKLFDFPYILYVGDRFGYKNFRQFITNVVPTLNKHKDLKIVCTGHPFYSEEIAFFDSLGIKNRVDHFLAKTDTELFSLYRYASVFVYPSDYEGFGIPILEAYAADCPVLLNNASCFPEIAGDAAVYFSFGDKTDLSDKLESILNITGYQKESLLQKQRERLTLFSWDDSATKLADIYQSIL